jgi:biotin carboxyl carrier protein
MRRYTLGIADREFVIDVHELAADRFEVHVGEQSYEVQLNADEELGVDSITPGLAGRSTTAAPRPAAAPARAAPASAAATKAPRGGGGGGGGGSGALAAPMPGTILEVNVKAGDTVQRGQQIAVLDAMKMHNLIGAPRAGTIAEVCVTAGQAVGHGDVIVRFAEG